MAFDVTDKEFDRLRREFPWPENCPTCGGEKKYRLDGREIACDCQKQKDAAMYYYAANIPRRYHSLGLDDFVPRYRRENSGVVEAIEDYIEHFKDNFHYGRGLALRGPQGTGKTLLAVHILKQTVALGYTGYFMQFTDLINTWGSSWKDQALKDTLENDLKRRDLVVLDDIITDKRNSEGFLQSGLEAVFRHRYNNSLPTIITTNMREKEFERDFPRVLSLLSGIAQWLDLEGPDYRPTNLDTIETLVSKGERLPVK